MTKTDDHKKFETGIVLSGGGAHCMAHAGVLKALNENDIYPDIIAGVSAGAMVGVLYANKVTPDDILDIFFERKIFKYPGIKIKNKGLLNGSKVTDKLLKGSEIKEFADLEIPVYITTSNFNEGRQAVFYSGEIKKPLSATISIPLLFSGVEIEGDIHYDGGLIDNLPVELIRNRCHNLIGVNVNPLRRKDQFDSFQELIIRTAHIGTTARLRSKIPLCDLYIEPDEIMDYPLLRDNKLKETFDAGYWHTKELMKKNK
jgi:NTE family protein